MAWDVTSAGAKAGSGGCTADITKCKAVYDFLAAQSKDQKSYASSKIWGVVDGPWRLAATAPRATTAWCPTRSSPGSPKPRLDEVKFLPFTSDSAEFNVLKAGGTIDVGYVPTQDLPAKSSGSALPGTNPVGTELLPGAELLLGRQLLHAELQQPHARARRSSSSTCGRRWR